MTVYHVETQEDYDALMIYFEKKGFKWLRGEKPTRFDRFKDNGKDTCVYEEDGIISLSDGDYFNKLYKDEPIIEYKSKGENQMLNTECKQCKKKWYNRKAKYCSTCGKKLVSEPEFRIGDIVASKVLTDDGFSFVQLNEDLTNQFTSVDGFWYIKRDGTVYDGSIVVIKEYTRHATPEEIAEYKSALQFHEHGRDPFEIKEGDILSDSESNIFFVNEDIEIWNKEDFISGDFTFLKTAEEVNEWIKGE